MLVTFVLAIFGVYRLYSAFQEYRWRDDEEDQN